MFHVAIEKVVPNILNIFINMIAAAFAEAGALLQGDNYAWRQLPESNGINYLNPMGEQRER